MHDPKGEDDLVEFISKCSQVVDGLKGNRSFEILIEDFKRNIEQADSSWHLLRKMEESTFDDLRVMKLAAISMVNCLQSYEDDIIKAKEELEALRNPDKIQTSYHDDE